MPGTSNTRTRLSIVFVAALAIFMGLQSFAGAFPLIGGLHEKLALTLIGVEALINARSGAILVGAVVDPSKEDSDGDGLTNRTETRRTRTNPRKADTDGDGITDRAEVVKTKTNPRKADTDGDGFNDGVEVAAGSDPRNPASVPASQVPPLLLPRPFRAPRSPRPTARPPTRRSSTAQVLSTQSTVASFSFAATEQGSTFECRLDGGSGPRAALRRASRDYRSVRMPSRSGPRTRSGNVDAKPGTTPGPWKAGFRRPTPQADAIWTKPAGRGRVARHPRRHRFDRELRRSPAPGHSRTRTAASSWHPHRLQDRLHLRIDGNKVRGVDVHDVRRRQRRKQAVVRCRGRRRHAPRRTPRSPPRRNRRPADQRQLLLLLQRERLDLRLSARRLGLGRLHHRPRHTPASPLGGHSFAVRGNATRPATPTRPGDLELDGERSPHRRTRPRPTPRSPPRRHTTSTSTSAFSFILDRVRLQLRLPARRRGLRLLHSPKSYSGLALGGHSFAVRATDQPGTPTRPRRAGAGRCRQPNRRPRLLRMRCRRDSRPPLPR